MVDCKKVIICNCNRTVKQSDCNCNDIWHNNDHKSIIVAAQAAKSIDLKSGHVQTAAEYQIK